MIKELEQRLQELSEKRKRLIGYIKDGNCETSTQDIIRGQAMELLGEIRWLKMFIEKIKG